MYNPSDFFEPVQQTNYIESENYKKVEYYIDALETMSKLNNLSYYIIDYYKKSFFYVSSNPLFLSGYAREEVLRLGPDFYLQCVPDDDFELLHDLNIGGFNFFYNLPLKRRKYMYMSYDFRLKHKTNNNLIMINHKLVPLVFSDDGNIWMAICLVTLSTRKQSGNIHIIMTDENKKFDFCRQKRTFKLAQNNKLTKRETEILKYIAIGNRVDVISKKLKLSESTIKNHKTNIFKKLNASTSAEAVFCASKQNII